MADDTPTPKDALGATNDPTGEHSAKQNVVAGASKNPFLSGGMPPTPQFSAPAPQNELVAQRASSAPTAPVVPTTRGITPATPAQPDILEAVIIEETITPPPPKPVPPPAPIPQPAPPVLDVSPSISSDVPMQNDMAKILGGVKLPERHNQLAPQKTPEAKYETTLADPGREMPRAVPGFTPSEAPQGNAPKESMGSLHTLKDDLQHVVQENKISYVRAVALEEEKRHRIEERSPAPRIKKRSLLNVFIFALLIGTGALALGAVYVVTQQRGAESNAVVQSNILFAEQNVPFPVDNEAPADVRRTLASARNSGSLTLGAILQIIPVRTTTDPQNGAVSATPISFGEFLTALGTRAPAELSRALADEFFFGIHTVDENAPVIIVPVTSYERAFAAMLEWEAYMNADLEPLFTLLPPRVQKQDGTLSGRVFEDTIMRNYDVRALKDDQGMIQLYYSFPTRNILIIAESPYSFTEVMSRLRADRRL